MIIQDVCNICFLLFQEFDIKHAEQRVQQAMQSPSVQEISREEREYDYKIIVKGI